MTSLAFEVIEKLNGKTLVTAESCTGGGIGAALTAVPGSSAVYKGGVISYTDKVKKTVLGVDAELLNQYGAVSAPVAQAMAAGVRQLINASIAVSVTGLAGPGGDKFGNPVIRDGVVIHSSDAYLKLFCCLFFLAVTGAIAVHFIPETRGKFMRQD